MPQKEQKVDHSPSPAIDSAVQRSKNGQQPISVPGGLAQHPTKHPVQVPVRK